MKTRIEKLQRGVALLIAAGMVAPLSAIAQTPAPDEGGAEELDYRPKKYSVLRYSNTVSNSPFERDILPPTPPPPPPPDDPFDFKLISVGGREGNYRITVIDKKGKYMVVTKTPDGEGFHYSNVEPAAKIQDFKVEVTKGQQSEWVEFDSKRFSVASKAVLAAKKPTNTKGRPSVVPNNRTAPPSRAPVPKSSTAKAVSQKSGAAAASAIQKANSTAVQSAQEKSRVSGRRVVLPPKNR